MSSNFAMELIAQVYAEIHSCWVHSSEKVATEGYMTVNRQVSSQHQQLTAPAAETEEAFSKTVTAKPALRRACATDRPPMLPPMTIAEAIPADVKATSHLQRTANRAAKQGGEL